MVYKCDACQRTYEINRSTVTCQYCGSCRMRPADRAEVLRYRRHGEEKTDERRFFEDYT